MLSLSALSHYLYELLSVMFRRAVTTGFALVVYKGAYDSKTARCYYKSSALLWEAIRTRSTQARARALAPRLFR